MCSRLSNNLGQVVQADDSENASDRAYQYDTIAAHFAYYPFGNTVVNIDPGNQFPYRFSTKPLDSETGLYYYNYRYYDPATGLWPSWDPIGENGGVNILAFVGNDGINGGDYLGVEDCSGDVSAGHGGVDPSGQGMENLLRKTERASIGGTALDDFLLSDDNGNVPQDSTDEAIDALVKEKCKNKCGKEIEVTIKQEEEKRDKKITRKCD